MKNLFFALAFMLIGSFAFGNSNKSVEAFSKTNIETLAHCEISDPAGFYGKGNCKKVLEAYRQWKALRIA